MQVLLYLNAHAMYRICEKNPQFTPSSLHLDPECRPENFSINFLDQIHNSDYDNMLGENPTEDDLYHDPLMSDVLQRIGPALKDLTVEARDSITPDIFDYTSNRTALRLYWYEDMLGILPECRRCLITLEFVSPGTFALHIVQHLFESITFNIIRDLQKGTIDEFQGWSYVVVLCSNPISNPYMKKRMDYIHFWNSLEFQK